MNDTLLELQREIYRLKRKMVEASSMPNIIHQPLTDYSATSTIVGWSGFTTKALSYCRYGNLCYVIFALQGTSDNVATTFTLPYNSAVGHWTVFLTRVQDNGGTIVAGHGSINTGSATVGVYSTVAGAAWTASGTKLAQGEFFYWTA